MAAAAVAVTSTVRTGANATMTTGLLSSINMNISTIISIFMSNSININKYREHAVLV